MTDPFLRPLSADAAGRRHYGRGMCTRDWQRHGGISDAVAPDWPGLLVVTTLETDGSFRRRPARCACAAAAPSGAPGWRRSAHLGALPRLFASALAGHPAT
jgi:hypothetical protein